MIAEDLLRQNGIALKSYAPGRHYTTCPQCSRDRRTAEHRRADVLGVTIDGDRVHWGCNHCGWTGPEKGNGTDNGGPHEPLVTYVYLDKSGEARFRKVRNQPGRSPRFYIQPSDGAGGFLTAKQRNGKAFDKSFLYHADEVARAIETGRTILVVEGEKDADACRSLGFAATCSPDGASEPGKAPKWRKTHSDQLAGADIVVLNDNDPPGNAHAETTCKLSVGVAKRVRRLDLKAAWPQIPDNGDVSDWIAQGHTRAELEALIASAPDYAPASQIDPPQTGLILPSPSAPVKVARAFVDHNGKRDGVSTIAYWSHTWWTWRGPSWIETDPDVVRKLLYSFTADARHKDEEGWHPWSPNARKISDLVDALKAEAALPDDIEPPAWLDRRKTGTIVAVANGLLDVTTRTLMPPSPLYFGHVSVPFAYDPNAPSPTQWLALLRAVWPDDQAAIDALQEWFGYVVSGRTDLQKILVMVGPTRGGKGVMARILAALLGKRNVCGPTLSSLAETFGLQPMIGKSLAIISDARSGAGRRAAVSTTATERMLSISGEDALDVRRMHKMQYTGKLTARLHILSNELPRFSDSSGAIIGRLVVLVTKKSWLGRENHELENELQPELPGILNWALEGIERLVKNKGRFCRSASADEAVRDMLDMASPAGAFVRDRCTLDPAAKIATDTLYAKFGQWCEDEGHPKPDAAHFGRDLKAAFPSVQKTRDRKAGRAAFYSGIRLLKDGESDQLI
jgi:putative DNA primase/helicase